MTKTVAILAYNKKIADEINLKLAEPLKDMKWSPEQTAFIGAIKGNDSILLEAVAGSGKTTTLLAAAQVVSKNIKAGTVHSFGFAAMRGAVKTIKVNDRKVSNIAELHCPDTLNSYTGTVTKLVSFAKQRAIGIVGSIDNDAEWYSIGQHFDLFHDGEGDNSKPFPEAEVVAYAKIVLKLSNEIVNEIDYDDMVYLPVFHGFKFHTYDMVMVDEAQDTNPARRALVRTIVKKGGRVVAVGDRHQAIYGFTGADNDSLDLIAKDFNCKYMPLSITYRCPKAVVKFASQWVDHIQAADTAPEGSVQTCTIDAMMKRNDLNGTAAILCRNTAPIVSLAFSLIRKKIACKVEGRELGAGLKRLCNRWKIATTAALITKLDDYATIEKAKALAKKNEGRAQMIDDQVETLKIIIEGVNAEGNHEIRDVIVAIDSLFSDDVSAKGILTLSTIHKSKGREWNTVFWLNRAATCPSKYARQKWQLDQEVNLMYVAATRAQETLIDLS